MTLPLGPGGGPTSGGTVPHPRNSEGERETPSSCVYMSVFDFDSGMGCFLMMLGLVHLFIHLSLHLGDLVILGGGTPPRDCVDRDVGMAPASLVRLLLDIGAVVGGHTPQGVRQRRFLRCYNRTACSVPAG